MTRKTFAMSALVSGIWLLHTARVAAPLTLYDDFESPRISIRRWVAFSDLTASLEVLRKIQGGKLALELTLYGQRDTDAGFQTEFNGLAVGQSPQVTQLGAEVTIESYRLTACPANTSPPFVRLEVAGNFFNDGSGAEPGDQTGDIRVRLALEAQEQSESGMIFGAIARCTSSTCGASETLVSRPFDLPWRNGQPVTLLVIWQPQRNSFTLRVSRGQQNEVQVLNYSIFGFPDPEPRAGSPIKFIRVLNRVVNCTTGRQVGAIGATVDNVRTNDLTPPEAAE
jgi:hypothetical protein